MHITVSLTQEDVTADVTVSGSDGEPWTFDHIESWLRRAGNEALRLVQDRITEIADKAG